MAPHPKVKCPSCPKWISKSNLSKHKCRENAYRCPYCAYVTEHRHLRRHIEGVHVRRHKIRVLAMSEKILANPSGAKSTKWRQKYEPKKWHEKYSRALVDELQVAFAEKPTEPMQNRPSSAETLPKQPTPAQSVHRQETDEGHRSKREEVSTQTVLGNCSTTEKSMNTEYDPYVHLSTAIHEWKRCKRCMDEA